MCRACLAARRDEEWQSWVSGFQRRGGELGAGLSPSRAGVRICIPSSTRCPPSSPARAPAPAAVRPVNLMACPALFPRWGHRRSLRPAPNIVQVPCVPPSSISRDDLTALRSALRCTQLFFPSFIESVCQSATAITTRCETARAFSRSQPNCLSGHRQWHTQLQGTPCTVANDLQAQVSMAHVHARFWA